jgi:hypothetical protein
MVRPNTQPRAVSLATLLDREVDALDQLVGAVRHGICGARQFDEFEEQAQRIARNLVGAFRSAADARR